MSDFEEVTPFRNSEDGLDYRVFRAVNGSLDLVFKISSLYSWFYYLKKS